MKRQTQGSFWTDFEFGGKDYRAVAAVLAAADDTLMYQLADALRYSAKFYSSPLAQCRSSAVLAAADDTLPMAMHALLPLVEG